MHKMYSRVGQCVNVFLLFVLSTPKVLADALVGFQSRCFSRDISYHYDVCVYVCCLLACLFTIFSDFQKFILFKKFLYMYQYVIQDILSNFVFWSPPPPPWAQPDMRSNSYIYLYLSISSLYLLLQLTIYLFIYRSISLFSIHLSIFISSSLCLSVYLFISLSLHLSIHVSLHKTTQRVTNLCFD